MNLITLDFETYYDNKSGYSLRKMSTEDYISDPQFEIIALCVKVNDGPVQAVDFPTIKEYKQFLLGLGIEDSAVLCHNTAFDGLILAARMGIYPAVYLDTMSMAMLVDRVQHKSVSLASCLARRPHLGVQKLDTVLHMAGKRKRDITPQELADYKNYCTHDVEGTYRLFKDMLNEFPRSELEVIDTTLRMYLQPTLELNGNLLKDIVARAKAEAEEAYNTAMATANASGDVLRSNSKFAALLEQLGVSVPRKVSPSTGQLTFALAKNDAGWLDLVEQYADDPVISPLLMARTASKSNIVEKRAEKLLSIATKYGKFRVPLRYYAAHTGRYGGFEGINPQNFNRIRKNGGRAQLRYAIEAPPDHVVLAGDLSQIEARINAWLAGEMELIRVFATRGDPYATFASKLFGRPIVKGVDDKERFIGKTCILGLGYGMGAPKLQATLRKDGIKLSPQEAKRYVDTYRYAYPRIQKMWYDANNLLFSIIRGDIYEYRGLFISAAGIRLPNGQLIRYPSLRHDGQSFAYMNAGEVSYLWGGKVIENVVQSMARGVIIESMLRIKRELGIQPSMQVHDELVYVVPAHTAAQMAGKVREVMCVPPSWAENLPVDAEVNFGPTYGDCK